MELIKLDNEILYVEQFLSPKACASLIRRSEGIGYETSKVQSFDGRQVVNKNVRNNERVLFFDESLAQVYWEKAKQFIPAKYGNYEAYGLNEMFRFYKYQEGQQFRMHQDNSYNKSDTELSFFTFLIYLNEGYKGGETSFEDRCTIAPKEGALLLFYHPLYHQGNEVLEGVKYVLRTDVMFRKIK